jgi:hypothetical protein
VLPRRHSLPASALGRQPSRPAAVEQKQQQRQAVPAAALSRHSSQLGKVLAENRLPVTGGGGTADMGTLLAAKQQALGGPAGMARRRENQAAELQSKLWQVASQLRRQDGDGQVGSGGSPAGRLRVELGEVQAKLEAVEKELEQQEQEQRAPAGRPPAGGRHLENQAAELSVKLRTALWQSHRSAPAMVWQQRRPEAHGPPAMAGVPRPSRQSSGRLSQAASLAGRGASETGPEPRLPSQASRPARAVLAQR